MKILCTGGGGYLGCVLVRALLSTGHRALGVYDRFSWGTQPLAGLEHSQYVRVWAADLNDDPQLREACDWADAIIHLAGIVGYPACDADPQDADRTNVFGTGKVCIYGVGKPIVFASTGSCYGKLPVGEEATEDTALSPLTRYSRNKRDAERLVLTTRRGTVLRLATLYGLSPRMRWDLLPHDFCRKALQTGSLALYEPTARRTFLHVEDAASAFLWALRTAPGGVWNVGGENLTKLEVAQAIQALTPLQLTEQPGEDADGRDYAVSYRKIQEAGGWHPGRTLRETLPTLLHYAEAWT